MLRYLISLPIIHYMCQQLEGLKIWWDSLDLNQEPDGSYITFTLNNISYHLDHQNIRLHKLIYHIHKMYPEYIVHTVTDRVSDTIKFTITNVR
jgi:hypothetical protein